MAIQFDQKPESGTWSLGKATIVHEYVLSGTVGEFPDTVDAATYLDANVPLFFEGLWLQDIIITPLGPSLYDVTCPYGPLSPWPDSTSDDLRINFRTTGGSVHISSSREMIEKYGLPSALPPPPTVIIGQDGSGAEITVPVQMRSYVFNFASGVVTEPAMDYWEDLTGHVNKYLWHYRPAGEVLFLGAEGETTISAGARSSVTFNFAMSRNKVNQTIGDITGIAKDGHDLIDIHTRTEVILSQDVQKEKYVYIQRAYERLDFATFLGF